MTRPDSSRRQRALATATMSIAVLAGALLAPMWQPILSEERPQHLDPDGALQVPSLKWPPSDYWTPEFLKAYVEHMSGTLNAPVNFGLPRMNAPKSEWLKFDSAAKRDLGPVVTQQLDHFRVTSAETEIGGVHAAILTPRDGIAPENRQRVLLNLHGFAHGLSEGELESIPIVSLGRIKVITLDYRLEPYYTYPASSEDAEAAYRVLIKQYKPEAIGIFGSSAGGVVVAQVVARLQARGLPRPGGIGIFWSGLPAAPFPWGKSGDSKMWGFRTFLSDDQSEVDKLHMDLGSWYLRGIATTDPQAYPGSSDAVLAKFPPTLFLTGTRSIDMSPTIVSHAHLLELNVDSSLYVMEGGWHGANIGEAQDSAEAKNSNAYVACWFGQHLKREH